MPTCENCGHHITPDYARVFSRDGDGVECCPHCPDRIRRDGQVQDARSSRENRDTHGRYTAEGDD